MDVPLQKKKKKADYYRHGENSWAYHSDHVSKHNSLLCSLGCKQTYSNVTNVTSEPSLGWHLSRTKSHYKHDDKSVLIGHIIHMLYWTLSAQCFCLRCWVFKLGIIQAKLYNQKLLGKYISCVSCYFILPEFVLSVCFKFSLFLPSVIKITVFQSLFVCMHVCLFDDKHLLS